MAAVRSDNPSIGLLDWIEREQDRLVEDWREACRIPSISATNAAGVHEMADWLERRLEPLVDSIEAVPVAGQGPVLLGHIGKGGFRLLSYTHYDVQPVEPQEEWMSPPFAAALEDGVVVARGACDDKADVLARLHALEAWREVVGELPLSLTWICEGAEEIGSPGLGGVLAGHRSKLAADGCLWESYIRRPDGRPELAFGCKGMLYVELCCTALGSDKHSAFAPVFPSAARRLVAALASIADEGGVRIDGFYDDVRTPTADELAAAADVELPEDERLVGAPGGAEHEERARRLLFEPTANIAGLVAGHTGTGMKTVLPAQATAKLDFRLAPRQQPGDIARKLRDHLDRKGFADIELAVLSSTPPSQCPLDSRFALAVASAAGETQGPPVMLPLNPGTGPLHLVSDGLGVPVVIPAGTTRLDSGIHAPNEHGRVNDYLDQIRFTLRLFERLARLA